MSISSEQLARAKQLLEKHGTIRKAAAAIGVPKSTFSDWLRGGKRNPTSSFVVRQTMPPPSDSVPRRHLIIPDTQVRPGVPLDHLDWIGKAIVDYRPDVVVHLGDHFDFPSLNSHEKPGSLPLEGLRYADDVRVGNEGFARICRPMEAVEKKTGWRPEKHYIMGNHDIRPDRVASDDPKLVGSIGSDQCDTRDWVRHPFLEIVRVDGILYSHFFQSSHSDRAIGGTVPNKLSKIGSSFAHGHVQGLDIGTKMMANGLTLWGIQAGSCYLHEESYRGAQGQRHFRGIIILNEARGGECCPMVLSLDYLCRRYTGMSLHEYMCRKYQGQSWNHLK